MRNSLMVGGAPSVPGLRALDIPPHPANEPLANTLLALSSGIRRPTIKVEGFPIILPRAVINGNVNFA